MTDASNNPDDRLEKLLRQWGARQAMASAQTPPAPVRAPSGRRGLRLWQKLSYALAAGLLLAAGVAFYFESRQAAAPAPPASPLAANAAADARELKLAAYEADLRQARKALSAAQDELARQNKKVEEQGQQLAYNQRVLKQQEGSLKDLAESAREADVLRRRLADREKLLAEQARNLPELAMAEGDTARRSKAAAPAAPARPGPANDAGAAAESTAEPKKAVLGPDSLPVQPPAAKPAPPSPPPPPAEQLAQAETASLRKLLQEKETQVQEKQAELAIVSKARDSLRKELDVTREELGRIRERQAEPPPLVAVAPTGGQMTGRVQGGAGISMKGQALQEELAPEQGAFRSPTGTTMQATTLRAQVVAMEKTEAPGTQIAAAPKADARSYGAVRGRVDDDSMGQQRKARADKAEGESANASRAATEFYWAQAQRAVLQAAGKQEGLAAWQAVARQLKIQSRLGDLRKQSSEPAKPLLAQVADSLDRLDNLDPKDVKAITSLRQLLDQQQLLASIDRELAANTDPDVRQVLVEARLVLTGL